MIAGPFDAILQQEDTIMKKIPYINYNELSGYYTVQQVAAMLRINERELAIKGQQYKIRLYRDDTGRYLLDSVRVKKLHYKLYHESRGRKI